MQSEPPKKPDQEPYSDCCRICGTQTKLSFEHVPPRSAFNRERAEMLTLEQWLQRDARAPATRGRIMQRGSGYYSLCRDCNSNAGRLYVPELRKWARMGMQILHGPNGAAAQFAEETERSYVTLKAVDMRPARFLKQLVTMFLAISPPQFPILHPDLCNYAQDPEWTGLPDRYQFYLALYSGPQVRYIGGASTLCNIGTDKPIEIHFVFEIAYPPYAYVLSIDEQTPALECGNLDAFKHIRIDQTAEIEVKFINGYGHTPLPLDYRTLPALEADREANRRDAA